MEIKIMSYGATPKQIVATARSGTAAYGLTDGRWSVSDMLLAMVEGSGGAADCVFATWTAGQADLKRAKRLLNEGVFAKVLWIFDRSMKTRHPEYLHLIEDTWGSESVLFLHFHAKFFLVDDWLYLTSANLNENRRIENYSLYHGGDVVRQYRAMVDGLCSDTRGLEAADRPGRGTVQLVGRHYEQMRRRQSG